PIMAAAGPVSRDARDSEHSEELYWQRQPRSGGRDHHSISETSRSRARMDAMGPTRPRHHLHGDDCQPAIRLDAVHRSDRTEVPLGRAAIQVAFTIFIVTETWLQPLGGYLIDRFGPRVMVCIGGALVATAWAINSVADSLALFYLAAIITGLG